MQSLKDRWFRVHHHIRKPITLGVGMLFVITSGLIGWLPGPGGIPLFLIGITILATEFRWAERIRDSILNHIYSAGAWSKRHPKLKIGIIVLIIITSLSLITYLFLR